MKYTEINSFLDLWLGIISVYLNLEYNKRFRPYLPSTIGPLILFNVAVFTVREKLLPISLVRVLS